MEIINSNDKKAYTPVLEGEMYIETYRSSMPSKVCFNVIKDSIIDFSEGRQLEFTPTAFQFFSGMFLQKLETKTALYLLLLTTSLGILKTRLHIILTDIRFPELLIR